MTVTSKSISSDASFPIVALGGSAGGLKAFTSFFEAVEESGDADGIAFVVISHLSPDHKSHLAELLQHAVHLPVLEVAARTKIEPGHVYVLAPGQSLLVRQGSLDPRKRETGIVHHPVDDLFASLGKDAGSKAIAIVMSGTGSNGSAGLSAVREGGGLILAQNPDSAEFGEMPRRAIGTGYVDAILLPKDMMATIVRYAEHLRSPPHGEGKGEEAAQLEQNIEGKEPGERTAYKSILATLRARTSIDFRNYKTGTLQRRIGRRIGFLRLNGWDSYAHYLQEKPEEINALTDDLLIAVTSFFRDQEAWTTLRDEAIRPLIAAHQTDEPLRAWVAGCASGEEAYSLAILLLEEMNAQGKGFPIEIFATDPSVTALARARAGLYPEAAIQHLPKKLKQDYFEHEDDIARVSRRLRECVVFAPQNAVQDPPFSRMELLICRNVLIYLQPEIQQKVIRLFHFALANRGYLFLGSAESLGSAEYLYETVSKKWRLYRRLGPTRHDIIDFPVPQGGGRYIPQYPTSDADKRNLAVRRTEEALKALAARHAPPSVLIDGNLQALYYHGAMERFLKPQFGEPTQDLAALARDGLGLRLRRLVEKAKETRGPQSDRGQIRVDGKPSHVLIEVCPVTRENGDMVFLASFMETKPARASGKLDIPPPLSDEQELEAEVRLLREEIRTSADVMNRSQEELKTYNEEIMSMNEELRAANEELETSKEELQSLNEELNTVNSQLRAKVDELHERTNDLDNLLSSTDVATLFLGRELQIRWFSPGIAGLFNVRPSDVGRGISDLAQKVTNEGFAQDCALVLRTLTAAEKQVRSKDGRWFVRRILPYRTRDDRIDGLVVTFSDVTAIQAAREYAESVVESAPAPLLVLDSDLRVVSANPAFYSVFDVSAGQTVQRLIYDLGNGQWNIPALRELLTGVLTRNEDFSNREVEHEFEKIGKKTMLLNGRRVHQAQLILLVIEDITERKRGEAHLIMLMQELSHRVKNALAVVQGLAMQTLAGSASLEEFKIAFQGRLSALARGHSLLLKREWTSASLMQIVRDVTQAIDAARVSAEGPNVELAPRKALSINLALHELVTNATKYGALTRDGGRIAVRWEIKDGDAVRLIWQESGGPRVTAPEHRGFGTNLILQIAEYELDGACDLRFEPEGLQCVLTFANAWAPAG
jgi:two-component system CheB/CheR fusion protein